MPASFPRCRSLPRCNRESRSLAFVCARKPNCLLCIFVPLELDCNTHSHVILHARKAYYAFGRKAHQGSQPPERESMPKALVRSLPRTSTYTLLLSHHQMVLFFTSTGKTYTPTVQHCTSECNRSGRAVRHALHGQRQSRKYALPLLLHSHPTSHDPRIDEDLIKYAWPQDVWFHVDKLSSAHVYLRLPPGMAWERIPEPLLADCAQLVKANSIEGVCCAGAVRARVGRRR